jgi:hypothetical protein
MSHLTPALHALLQRAVVSLPTWHVLEALATRLDRGPLSLAVLLGATGLEVTQAKAAIATLRRIGLVRCTAAGEVRLAPRHAEDVERLVEAVDADRTLLIAVIKQAARRECATGPLHKTIARRAITARLGRP